MLLGDFIVKWQCNNESDKVDSIVLSYNFILLMVLNLFVNIFYSSEYLLKITN